MHERSMRFSGAILSLLLAFASAAHAGVELPSKLTQDAPRLHMLGSGKLTWFGLHVYDAALWASEANWNSSSAFALAIRYSRSFKGNRIAERSVTELERLGYTDPAKLSKWKEHMVRLFPDVSAGERLTGLYRPGNGVEFYHEDRLIGAVADPEFARAFFSIWLDPRTREPKLREQLIGVRE
jgi:hypothetical protein